VGGNFLNQTPGGGGWVWPAISADDNWQSTYRGQEVTNLYMGGLVAIPLSVDINGLGLRLPQSVNIARALQQYGAYIVDRGDPWVFEIILDTKTEPEWVPWHHDPNYKSDMEKIGAVTRIVKNSSGPGGGRPRNGVKLDGGDGALRTPLAPNFDR
jgi:hypothetical protein